MINNTLINNLINDLSKIKSIEGILLAGSRSTNTYDSSSDYDIYIYSTSPVSKEERTSICNKYFKYIEISNNYFEEEDDGILNDNTPVEIIYRSIDFITSELDNTLLKYNACCGYSTCFWYNFINSIILYDKSGKMKYLQDYYNIPYPKELENNIIIKNYSLLKEKMPAYYYQIEKAIKRNDNISINHRIAALFASYFDIIFAYNHMPHPGEKKILQIIKNNNLLIPNNMENNINNILKYSILDKKNLLKEIDSLIENLNTFLKL